MHWLIYHQHKLEHSSPFQGRRNYGYSVGSSSLPEKNEVYIPYTGLNSFYMQHSTPLNHVSSFRPHESISHDTPHNPYLYSYYNNAYSLEGHKRPHQGRQPSHRPYYSASRVNQATTYPKYANWQTSAPSLSTSLPRPKVT